MSQKPIHELLSRFFPLESVDLIRELVDAHHFQLHFRRGRATKLGDFRPAMNGKKAVITINGDLNVYASLIIFLHELAHLLVWKEQAQREAPHGKRWKECFGQLLRQFADQGCFHPTLTDSLIDYSYSVKASGIGNEAMLKELRRFDQTDDETQLLGELPERTYFLTKTGRLFRKGEQLRKRYKCFCLDNKKTYLFNPLAKVKVADTDYSNQSQKYS